MLRPILNASRYLVIPAVVGALAASVALFVYGLAETAVVIVQAIANLACPDRPDACPTELWQRS